MKRETNQMTQQNLLRALKQLYPGAATAVEEKLKGHIAIPVPPDDAYEGRVQGYGQMLTYGPGQKPPEVVQMNDGSIKILSDPNHPPQGISTPFDGRLRPQKETTQQVMERQRKAIEEADARMAQGIAQKTGALTPGQRQAARQNAEKALAIALFHTDPRIHAHLLMDAANDVPETMDIALVTAWRTDLNGWRTQATERAEKMVAIMDGLGIRDMR